MNRMSIALPALLSVSILFTAADAHAVKFRFPVIDTERIQFDYVIGCDHDPEEGAYSFDCLPWCAGMDEYPDCTESFPYCYDAHYGTDFMLIDGFAMMDNGSADVVAAADGTVISVEDGHFDRCQADLLTQEVTCYGNPIIGNHVKIRHADDMETWYWHFMKDSIVVKVGDEVSCGEVLGKIGSSGYSSGPHLHFEFRIPDGEGGTTWIDPYAGLNSQPESYWVLQRDPTTLLPGCYCEGDEIPDFPEPSDDIGGEDVIVVEDVYEDVPADVADSEVIDAPDIEVVADESSWESWDADTGAADVSTDLNVNPGEIRDMSGESWSGDMAAVDASPSADEGFGELDVSDSAGGCSSSGSRGASSNGLMLLLAAGILALVLRRRGTAR